MAKLTGINLPDATDKKSRKNIPTVHLETPEGDVVKRYNEARDAKDKAEALMKELAPALVEAGVKAVFDNNCENPRDPKKIISSVNIADKAADTGAGNDELLMVSWTKKDLKNDPQMVESTFARLRTRADKLANVNNYATFEPVAEFDAGVFMVGGKFSQERYDTITQALDEVSSELGVPNPLTCSRVLKPKSDFHEIRWAMFDLESNLAIQKVLPTQVNLKPIRPEANGIA